MRILCLLLDVYVCVCVSCMWHIVPARHARMYDAERPVQDWE